MTSGKTANPKPPLRVGFDLDGVILYNPARVIRPFISGFKHRILGKTKTKFYVPQQPWEQTLFRLLHKSSIYVAPGLADVRQMVRDKQITAFLITARFDFLKPDLDVWLNRIQALDYFEACYHNQKNQQPHLFKAQQIRDLKLDVFIEDNFDIVSHLVSLKEAGQLSCDVYWVYNLFDRSKPYRYKYPNLQQAINAIKSNLI